MTRCEQFYCGRPILVSEASILNSSRANGFANLYKSLTENDKTLVFDHDSESMHQLRAIVTQEWDVMFEQAKNMTSEELNQHPNLKKWALTQKDKAGQ